MLIQIVSLFIIHMGTKKSNDICVIVWVAVTDVFVPIFLESTSTIGYLTVTITVDPFVHYLVYNKTLVYPEWL